MGGNRWLIGLVWLLIVLVLVLVAALVKYLFSNDKSDLSPG
jgi:uncharacterized membrane protein YdfJ with MMPL/SSD domain